ncbi:MAG: hypothetical protein J7K98_02100 [Candidatus Aenigmarchaeota archaeon]|nr:hypothetical protein [Candidatus Aenigmarchaeota archaeon]
MNHRDKRKLELLRFYREQLFEAKSKLFQVRSVRQVKFLQHRIEFLQQKIKEIENS